MKKLRLKILAYLLSHANRCPRPFWITDIYLTADVFYSIKNELLKKYAVESKEVDLQFIDGKKCFACNGRGLYYHEDWEGFESYEDCYECNDGWYKSPFYTILYRYEICGKVFHQPKQKFYYTNEKHILSMIDKWLSDNNKVVRSKIEGYISHNKYSKLAVNLFWALYVPDVFWNGLFRKSKNRFKNFYEKIGKYFEPKQKESVFEYDCTDDLPF